MRVLVAVLATVVSATPAAQWLSRPTPGIPRTADGAPDLAAPAPRATDGRPDLAGVWTLFGGRSGAPDRAIVLPWALARAREHQDAFLKDRPSYRCRPSGPEPVFSWKRVVQTPTVIAILNDDLTYRQIFMDGRALEAEPHPTWMGYSVGHWEADTLVVDSFGFNDKTWLHISGLPHTEALRVRERIRRLDVGRLQIEVTYTDPGAYTKSWGVTLDMRLAVDTEMIETVCEGSSDHWAGRWSDIQKSQVGVHPDLLARYVGVYSGLWAGLPRTVRVLLTDGALSVVADGTTFPLVADSDGSFTSAQGYVYDFDGSGDGPAAHLVEHHVSGSYTLHRQP